MKKTAYMQPTTAVANMSIEQLICASPGSTPKVGGTTDNEDDLLSREQRRSVWDDEETDEEDF